MSDTQRPKSGGELLDADEVNFDLPIVVTAGETINGGTLPVPVYMDDADNEVKACDGNDQARLEFIGFAVSNSTDGNPITFQKDGVVDGFSGLDIGKEYFVQDAVGTIGTSVGTYEVKVGIAISATQILIIRGVNEYMGSVVIANNDSVAIDSKARKLIISFKIDNNESELKTNITLTDPGITSQHVSIKTWTGGGGEEAQITFTWAGGNLTTSNNNLSANATVYMYR